PTVLVMLPKTPAAAAEYGWPGCTRFASVVAAFGSALGSVATGFEKLARSNRLKTSIRNSTLLGPEIGKGFDSTRSVWLKPGPCSEPRSRLPKVPGFGVANAAGFRNSTPPLWRNGSTPGTRSGRRTLRELPPPGVLISAVRPAAGLLKTVPDPST